MEKVVTVARGGDRIVSDRPIAELVERFGASSVFVDGVAVADSGDAPVPEPTEPEAKPARKPKK